MKMQLIRNATLRVTYAGHTFIIDPYLAPKHSLPSYTGRSLNPLVDLPLSPHEVIAGIETAVVSHLHTDHFDPLAQELLPKGTKIFCQPKNEARIREIGFVEVVPVTTTVRWQAITIHRTPGRHGSSEAILRAMGEVSGFVFEADNEPTVYWAGDTVWYDAIRENIDQWRPDIIITHSGGAVWGDNELIIMDAQQTVALCEYAPEAIVVATHMEALDHCLTSREALRNYAREHGIQDEQLRIPEDRADLEF
ncbi:MAG: MBL fold metallo-hydrolase [Anaerolineaceae bacterium]|nr:MBL fold metallo-hydrolase [Anaerolineaceae bacterium]